MVCSKCQRTLRKTTLATPGVKHKNDITTSSSKSSTTLGNTGVGKSKLLSKNAKNPYAAYSSTCSVCKAQCTAGHKLCQRCAYKAGNGKDCSILTSAFPSTETDGS